MSISFGNNIVIYEQWTDLKTSAVNNTLSIQYQQLTDRYTIFVVDANVVQTCTIYTGTIPNFINTDTGDPPDQATNDSYKSDFETNYKPTANSRISRTDEFGDPIHLDFVDAVSFGLIPNATIGTANGYIGTAATTTVAVRATSYIADTVAAQRSIVSSSANDASAGTGARTVKITYYDNTVNGPFTETVTMNGTTPVNTVNTNIRFIEKIEVMTVGSTGANAGTISLKQNVAGGGSTLGSIAISDNQTYWAHHYVAAGKVAHVYAVRAGSSVTNGIVNVIATGDPTATNLPSRNISNGIRMGSANQVVSFYEWVAPLSVTGPNFVFINTKPDAITASTIYASFDYSEF